MLCVDFESQLTEYLEGALGAEAQRMFSEHALRCPVCHQTLSEVKNTLQACRVASVPPPTRDLEAVILQKTMPESGMTCDEFEASLTDYLDGFLPAPLFHRWERHAALCDRCTELPGEVVRSIGACYTYVAEEMPLPFRLNERILQATLGTFSPQEVRAPFSARLASRLRLWLDPIVSPQLATVATMLLVAIFVLTNTVSADGSIGGVYSASLRLAAQSYSSGSKGGIKEFTNGLREIVGRQSQAPQDKSKEGAAGGKPDQKETSAPSEKPEKER
jgi:anti-sigma factor RsiW